MDPKIMENLNCGWSPQDPSKTRRLKVILPQFYEVLAIFAVNLSHEIFINFTFMDIIGHESISHTLYRVIGLLIGGIVVQYTGARAIVMLAGTSSVVGWISLEWISSVTVLQWTFYIVSFTKDMMQAPAYVYLAEMSQPNMRSVLMAVMCLSSDIRSIYLYLVAAVEYAKITAIVHIFFAVSGLTIMFFLPESPYWLDNKGCYHLVELSLAWFRGRTFPENVKSESKAIISNAQNSPTALKLFFKQSLYLLTVVACSVFVASAFVRIFYETQFIHLYIASEARKYNNLLLLLWCISTIIISISFVVLISMIRKRVMILISLFGGSMALLIASIAGYLRENQILSTDAYWYFFLICLAVAYLSLIIGVIPIPLLLNGELFPSKLRNLEVSQFGLFFAFVVQAVSDSLYAMYFDSAHGALLALAFTSIFGFLLLLWLFPGNENNSLVEIDI